MLIIHPSFYVIDTGIRSSTLRRIEEAGRTCYKSEDKITDDSADQFIRRLIKSGHESVLEHENLSVRFIVDRGVSHELVRHRLCAFSQESTRYVNYDKHGLTFIKPPWVYVQSGIYDEHIMSFNNEWLMAMAESAKSYHRLIAFYNWSPQQARAVLPNSLKTELVMTANLREWRHVLRLRASKAAHPQMQEVMRPLLTYMNNHLPAVFEDIVEEIRIKES
jgi:thymidylate synthase (FAD)